MQQQTKQQSSANQQQANIIHQPPQILNFHDSDHQSSINSQQSSFNLDDRITQRTNKEEAIQNVLNRLGLQKPVQAGSRQHELEMLVGNVVQNWVGTVDSHTNLNHYESMFSSQYSEAVKNTKKKSSIVVSPFTDVQNIQMLGNHGFVAVIKEFRLFLKKFSSVCGAIVDHNLFEAIVLIVIVLNSIKMAVDDPLTTQDNNQTIETIFIVFYTIEMLIKILAYGFIFNKGSYLRDIWNILDFVIVFTSLLPYVISFGFSVHALRAIRVLRPLKTITKVKALKMIVSTLFHSFSLVMDSLYILLFVILVFAIAGNQLFSGVLKNRCIQIATGNITDTLCISGSTCYDGFICGRGIENPNFSIQSFDTILWSILSVFQTLTLEGWSDIMIDLQMTYSPVSAIYSILIVFFCEYVILNMTMAILKYKYSQVKGNTIQQQQQQLFEYQPQFLKKLGIYKYYTKMLSESQLQRYYSKDKIFIGAIFFNDMLRTDYEQGLQNVFESHYPSMKSIAKIATTKSKKFDISKLPKNSKIDELKWDIKSLEFDSINFVDNIPIQYTKSNRAIKIESDSEDQNNSQKQGTIEEENQSFDETDSEGNHINEQSQESFINQKVLNLQKKLNQSKKYIQQINFDDSYTKKQFSAPKSHQNNRQETYQSEHNGKTDLQKLIQSTKNIQIRHRVPSNLNINSIIIPQIDFSSYRVDEFYNKFNDLGQNKVKRIEKSKQLNYFNIKPQKKFIKPEIKSHLKQVIEDNSLDIKQLHLVNELSKLKMKCKIKTKKELDSQQRYEKTRVLTGIAAKERNRKIQQYEQNVKKMVLNLKYKPLPKQQFNYSPYKLHFQLHRNYECQIKGLKITEFKGVREKEQSNKAASYKSIGAKTVNYMKLLQNYKMEEKIELTESKIMSVFFRESKGQKNENEKRYQSQYYATQQSDISNNHRQIRITSPVEINQQIQQEFLHSINIQDEEYEIYIRGILGILIVIRKKIALFINKPLYDNFILLIVIANTITLSLNGLVNTDSGPLVSVNLVFTIIFAIDLGLKIIAYGVDFFSDFMNIFDSFIVSISIVQITIGTVGANLSALRSIRILRAFRVLRITRLVRSLSYMKVVMSVVSSVITEFIYVLLLMALFIFIYTLLGMQLFGGGLQSEEISGIRQNFDTFLNSFFSVFQIMTVENWNDIETAILVSGSKIIGIIYLISWIFIGNWILMSLIQAILLDGFDEDSSPQATQSSGETTTFTSQFHETQTIATTISTQQTFTNQFKNKDTSLLMFYPNSWVRMACGKIVYSKIFDIIIIVSIMLSSIKLVIDSYIEPNTRLYEISDILDSVFSSIFILECVLKVITKGLILGENTYLKDYWSILDFIITITSIIDMSSQLNLQILKLFRTLRPLRIISKNLEMKIIISSLAQSMCGIFNVLIIILCVFLMFGILGMNLLQDKLYYCNLSGSQYQVNNYGPYNIDQSQCQAIGGAWINQFVNFDNVFYSLLSMYVFSTRQNWPYYVYTFIDAGENVTIVLFQGPQKDANQLLYFLLAVGIIFICSYFFMDLLVGVLFMNFHEAEKKMKPQILNDKQINWKNLQKLIIEEDPCFELFLSPNNKFQKFVTFLLFQFHSIVTKRVFDIFITCCIVGNIILMMISQDDQSKTMTSVLSQINLGFSAIFMLEMVLKLIAFGKAYFYSGWNIFDFFVVLASILDIVLSYTGISGKSSAALSVLPQIARIFRVMRVTKILRMFKRFKGLQKLIETFLFSIPALGRGLSIVSLFMFISSILSTFLFEGIVSDYSGNFSDYKNFSNFHVSLQTLFIATSGENWYYFMYESIIPGYVTCSQNTQCVQPVYILFWIAYIFLSQKVFMELFVLIVLDQFQSNYIKENNPLGIFALFEQDFRNNWIELTTKYKSQKIETKKLLELLLSLRKPLGLGRQQLVLKYQQKLRQNQRLSQEQIQQNLKDFQIKLKRNGAKIIQKMDIIKNRLYLTYNETFYYFAKHALMPDFLRNATNEQLNMLDEIQKQSENKLSQMVPKGANYQNHENAENNQPLNPIELILFSQMIVKSWNNYSLKFHSQKNKNTDQKNSLNNSCSSDVAEAQLQKLPQQKRASKRKGVLQGFKINGGAFQIKPMPEIDEHYQNEKKKLKKESSMFKRQQSIQSGKNSINISGAMNLSGAGVSFSSYNGKVQKSEE